jgi:hypothetical protein
MRRYAILAAFAAGCTLAAADRAAAAEPPPSAACMAPIPQGSADPVVRDVHFHVNAGGSLILVTFCVASNNADGLQAVAANVGIFAHDGVLINYAGQSATNVGPLTNPSGDAPKLVLMSGAAIQVDAKYGQQFAPNTVVALTSVACKKPLPACEAAPSQTQTFLLPVQIDQDLPASKPAK